MSKFCTQCGERLEDDARFCTKCGALSDAAPAPENPNVFDNAVEKMRPVVNSAMEKAEDLVQKAKNIHFDEVVETAKKDPKKMLVPAIAALAVIALVIVLILSLGGQPYTKAVDTMFDAMFRGKVDKIEKMAPPEYWEYAEDHYDLDLEDVIDDMSDALEDTLEDFEDEYGNNLRFSYEVQKEEQLSERKRKKLAEALEDKYDVDADEVKDAYALKLKMTIKGSEDDDTEKVEMTAVKIGKTWYLVTANDSYSSVGFLVEGF